MSVLIHGRLTMSAMNIQTIMMAICCSLTCLDTHSITTLEVSQAISPVLSNLYLGDLK